MNMVVIAQHGEYLCALLSSYHLPTLSADSQLTSTYFRLVMQRATVMVCQTGATLIRSCTHRQVMGVTAETVVITQMVQTVRFAR